MVGSTGGCNGCQVHHLTEWSVLGQKDQALVDQSRIGRPYIPGEVIYNEGDDCRGIFCVKTGLVGIRKYDSEGNSMLLHLAPPGETLGYRDLLTDHGHNSSAEALEESNVCFVSAGVVWAVLKKDPAIGLKFLHRAASELEEAEEKIFQNVTMPVRARFAHLLMVLINRSSDAAPSEGLKDVEVPISRLDMAAMIGTTPESVSRTIRKMEDEGVLHFSGSQGRYLSVPDLKSLADEFETRDFL